VDADVARAAGPPEVDGVGARGCSSVPLDSGVLPPLVTGGGVVLVGLRSCALRQLAPGGLLGRRKARALLAGEGLADLVGSPCRTAVGPWRGAGSQAVAVCPAPRTHHQDQIRLDDHGLLLIMDKQKTPETVVPRVVPSPVTQAVWVAVDLWSPGRSRGRQRSGSGNRRGHGCRPDQGYRSNRVPLSDRHREAPQVNATRPLELIDMG
jgi:hypothetical protein